MLMGILLSSLSYLLIYVLLVVREPYLLIPFPILFCLACIGTSSIGSVSRNQRYAWSALLAILFVVSFVGNKSLGMMFSPLVLLTTLWIIWLILKRYGDLYPVAATTIVLLFGMMSLFGQHASSERLKNLGTGPAEQAFVFLRRNFAENANMAAYSPNIPRAARMTWLDLTGIDTRAELRSDEDLQRWMNNNKVAGFYVDDLLRRFEPSLWALIENQIGKTSTIAFSSETPYIQILRVNAK